MGQQLSALKRDFEEILPKGPDGYFRSLHVMAHYGLIPSIYVYGLFHAGEFSWNPLVLMDKILFA